MGVPLRVPVYGFCRVCEGLGLRAYCSRLKWELV